MDWTEIEVAALRLAAQAETADAVDRCLGVLWTRPTTPEAEKRYGMHAGLVVAIVAEASVRGVERVVSLLNEQAGTSLALGPWVAASDAEGGFWTNDFGWQDDPWAASGFVNRTGLMANDQRWVWFADVAGRAPVALLRQPEGAAQGVRL